MQDFKMAIQELSSGTSLHLRSSHEYPDDLCFPCVKHPHVYRFRGAKAQSWPYSSEQICLFIGTNTGGYLFALFSQLLPVPVQVSRELPLRQPCQPVGLQRQHSDWVLTPSMLHETGLSSTDGYSGYSVGANEHPRDTKVGM